MQLQSQDRTGPEQELDHAAGRRAARSKGRRTSGREQRRIAAEQTAKRRRWWIVGGAIAGVLVVGLIYLLVTRPQDVGPPVLAAEAMPETIPVDGTAMGAEDAPVTIVEWGDYT